VINHYLPKKQKTISISFFAANTGFFDENNRFLLRASPDSHGSIEGYRRKQRGKKPIAVCSSLAFASIVSSHRRRINFEKQHRFFLQTVKNSFAKN
jgi:hypothetical protein